jgi:hypothetical protein
VVIGTDCTAKVNRGITHRKWMPLPPAKVNRGITHRKWMPLPPAKVNRDITHRKSCDV